MEKFQIQFSGLKPGTYSFDFDLDNSFFEHYRVDDVTDSKVSVHADMEKEDRMLIFHFDIGGNITVACDRCGDPLIMKLKGEQNLIVKLGDHNEEESEEVLVIMESESRFDISQFLYENVCLMIPVYRVHGNNSQGISLCNPDILKKLEELKESHVPDPRWEVLNKLRENK
ncbi:MAG: DUF177 domain-containing protein [Bacteroidetes bacterium]|nr:DUF177 domain-containing protein [Bacteroidota bacterium]